MKTNPELEQAIANDPDDLARAHGLRRLARGAGRSARGELMALMIAGKDAEAQQPIADRADHFLGELAARTKMYDGSDEDAFAWKYGFIDRARLSHDEYAGKPNAEATLNDVLRALLAHPSGGFLAELALGFNGDPNEETPQDLIDLLAEEVRPRLRGLVVGDIKYAGAARPEDQGEQTEISWYSAGDLSNLWQAVPNLRTLLVRSGSSGSAEGGGVQLGAIELPALRRFELHTGGLERAVAQSIARGKFPQLEHLDVWFGQENYGGTAGIDDARALLGRADLEKLRHLGIMNASFVDDLVEDLAKSPLLAQVAELDLSLGCLTDAGASKIAAHRDAFAHLAVLDVRWSYLSAAGVAALAGCAREIRATPQRSQPDSDRRYTAVGE